MRVDDLHETDRLAVSDGDKMPDTNVSRFDLRIPVPTASCPGTWISELHMRLLVPRFQRRDISARGRSQADWGRHRTDLPRC